MRSDGRSSTVLSALHGKQVRIFTEKQVITGHLVNSDESFAVLLEVDENPLYIPIVRILKCQEVKNCN